MAVSDVKRYEFEDWQLDPAERLLLRQGKPVALTPKVFDTLLVLVENAGRLVSKEEFMSRVWPDAFVEDAVLTQNIWQLRKVLGDSQAIETVSKKGYRFLKPIKAIGAVGRAEPQAKELAPGGANSSPAAAGPPSARALDGAQEWLGGKYQATGKKTWLVGASILLVAVSLTIALAYFRSRDGHVSPAKVIRSLAVLPLENLSGDPNQEYFADGMTAELITDLAQIHSLRVISRTSIVQFKHSQKKLPEIASELKVEAVVEGSVLRTGNHVRVTARLLDARQDRLLWAASYEREIGDILGLQAQVAEKIVEQVHASLTQEEGAKLAAHPPTDPESYDALLTGKYLFNRRTPADTEKAITYLRHAVELNPGNASAWATLAYCYTALGADIGVSDPVKVLPLARAALDKALQIDPNLADAHVTLAWIKLWYDWDWSGSEVEFRRALELNPNDSQAHREYAHLLQVQKRFAESIAENKKAIDLAPLDILASIHLAWTYLDAHDGASAVEQCKRVLEMDPAFTGANLLLAFGYEEEGKWPESVAAFERARERYEVDYLAGIAYVYAASGDKPHAQAAMTNLVEFSRNNYVSPLNFAACYAARGEKDHAFEWLQKAYKQHATGLVGLSVDSRLGTLHSDPRFTDLLRRMQLPE